MDLGLTLSEMDSLIKKPSKFSFETVYQLSLLVDCDYKKLVNLVTNYTIKKQMKPPMKKK
ncbi:hypothetical protein Niako_0506 [Niastella koreensis GR20-10]|uniref:Uncharacterized protein n=2 Tax=Niastella koreensis TaxID=354356 RepID=G8T7W3_NIAKG|nr:hypothetical protein [Niastella koreensis]AEV96901.1 hypothetical protein Niako_0506 [Niastella koreensis GR20-10]